MAVQDDEPLIRILVMNALTHPRFKFARVAGEKFVRIRQRMKGRRDVVTAAVVLLPICVLWSCREPVVQDAETGFDQTDGEAMSSPPVDAGNSSVSSERLVLKYSERLGQISVDVPEKLTSTGRSIKPFADATGKVTRVAEPFVDSPSIVGDRWTAIVTLDESVTFGSQGEVREISLEYDEHSLPFDPIQVDDRLHFELDQQGRLIDVNPAP